MKDDQNIDELLNSFIDEELSERQHTEVRRLIENNPELAQKLKELRRYRQLLSSLPLSQAPEDMLEDIKDSLERRALSAQPGEHFDDAKGAKELFLRKALSLAAVAALVCILAGVIYTIVVPKNFRSRPITAKNWQEPERNKPSVIKQKKTLPIFDFKVEIQTADTTAVNTFVSKWFRETSLSGGLTPPLRSDGNFRSVSCSVQQLKALLFDLKSIRHRFDSTVLVVQSNAADSPVTIRSVTLEQIEQIAAQKEPQNCIALAGKLAALNNINQLMPGNKVLAAFEDKNPAFVTIPKPVLTSSEKTIKKPDSSLENERNLQLTVIVTHSE